MGRVSVGWLEFYFSFGLNLFILRTAAQKNSTQHRETYAINIVLDNAGKKHLEQGTGNPAHLNMAIVIANSLFYAVDNASKTKTGIMPLMLTDYIENGTNEMISAITRKR